MKVKCGKARVEGKDKTITSEGEEYQNFLLVTGVKQGKITRANDVKENKEGKSRKDNREAKREENKAEVGCRLNCEHVIGDVCTGATVSTVASATCTDTCPSAHTVCLSGSHKHR